MALFFPLLWAVLAQSGSIGTAFPFLIVLWQLTIDEKNCKKEKKFLNYFHLNKVSKLDKENISFNKCLKTKNCQPVSCLCQDQFGIILRSPTPKTRN